MADNGNAIDIDVECSPIQTDEELKSNNRFVLGYVEANYMTDSDLTLTIYVKRDNDLQWEEATTITLGKFSKRYFGLLPQGLSVIDFYVSLTGSPMYVCEITSLKILTQPLILGKHG